MPHHIQSCAFRVALSELHFQSCTFRGGESTREYSHVSASRGQIGSAWGVVMFWVVPRVFWIVVLAERTAFRRRTALTRASHVRKSTALQLGSAEGAARY